VDKDADLKPGATLRVYADLLPASDGTAPFAIHTFNQIAGGPDRAAATRPLRAAIANDHFVFTGRADDDKQTGIGRGFARLHGIVAHYDITDGRHRGKCIEHLPHPPSQPGVDARYEIDDTIDLAGVRPMIAKPFSPGNAFPAEDVARERLTFDKSMIGSRTN